MKMVEHWKVKNSIWFKCGMFCHKFLFWSRICGDSEKNLKNCTDIKNIRTAIHDCCVCYIEDINLVLHGFCHTLYFGDNAIHISGWIIPSLPADQEGVPKTSLWGRWYRSVSEMGHWTRWVQLTAVIPVFLMTCQEPSTAYHVKDL